MMCSRCAITILASATRSLSFIASRMTANASAPTLPPGAVEVTLVDFGLRHEPFDVDRVRTLDLDRLQFVLVNGYIAPLGEFVAAAFVLRINDPAALFVDHLLPQTMAGLGIDLVEVRLFRLRGGREKLDRAGDERKTQIAFPVGAGHGSGGSLCRRKNNHRPRAGSIGWIGCYGQYIP